MSIQIKNVRFLHKKDYRVLLDQFQLTLNPGDKAVVIGEEGNGKSTLLKWISDPTLVEDYVEAEGERLMSGYRSYYLPQELSSADRQKSIYDFFCEEPLFYDQSPRILQKLARDFGLDEELFFDERKMNTLSGGERIKIQLVRMQISGADFYLLDEPSNDLDLETVRWLENFMINSDKILLFVSHDEMLIERTANKIIHLEQINRKTRSIWQVAKCNYRDYISERIALRGKLEQEVKNEKREEKKREEKFRKIMQKVEQEQNSVSRQDPHGGRLLKKKMKAVKSLEKRYEREQKDRTILNEEEDSIFFKIDKNEPIAFGKVVLDKTWDTLVQVNNENGEMILARNISLFVRGPEKIGIIGKNGVGKTTLLKKIREELIQRPDVKFEYMPQNYEELLDNKMTPVEFIAPSGEKEDRERARTFLGALKFTSDEMFHEIEELSGGQKAKLFLLKMSLSDAGVLLLDEPTRNFSPLSAPVIRKILSEYSGCIISVSHDRKYLMEVCTKIYSLNKEQLCPIEKDLL